MAQDLTTNDMIPKNVDCVSSRGLEQMSVLSPSNPTEPRNSFGWAIIAKNLCRNRIYPMFSQTTTVFLPLLSLFLIQPVAAGCIIAGSLAVPLMPPLPVQLVLILQTSEGWQAESTHLVLFNGETGARTQDPKILNQPPQPQIVT